jgi:ribosome biogenesis GTPase
MATPVIVLTKSDLCDDLPQKLDEIASVSMVLMLFTVLLKWKRVRSNQRFIGQGKTIAFVGSSGVGSPR